MTSFVLASLLVSAAIVPSEPGPVRLAAPSFVAEIDPHTGTWSLVDAKSGVRWPTEGSASAGRAKGLEGGFGSVTSTARSSQLTNQNGSTVTFALVDDNRSLEIRYGGKDPDEIRLLGDASLMTDREQGGIVVPCREGLLIPAGSGVAFEHGFGSSEYEGCHMNMLGMIKRGSALMITWDGADVWPEVRSKLTAGKPQRQELSAEVRLRQSARSVRLTPLGPGDWNTLAAGYRRIAEQKGLAVTLHQKIARNAHVEQLLGAANVKLWTCLERRMSEDSTRVERTRVHWTFDEAAQVAEHLKRDLKIDRSLFIIGGWTEGGYDCRHPDNLPANPECGGDQALAAALRRIQDLGDIGCLHDNYQDMYKDARSWDPRFIQKRADGSLMAGGRWLGGRAYLVCAPEQVKLAMRPQNLPAIAERFAPAAYFIDTTYAVGPQECFDAAHPLGRNDDIAWKIKLSEAARKTFGIFGSECGREWAVPCSDFFEGLVGVGGHDYHQLRPEQLGATVIPFWEMVYHDCEVCYGKYGYDIHRAGEYVAHHLLAARALNYHSIPDHLYWKAPHGDEQPSGVLACYTRCDQGWAAGFHPVDVFLKNTQEVLGPLQQATAHERLTRFEFLDAHHAVRRATYGESQEATVVVVNCGATEARVESRLGGSVLLPPWGFIVEGPRFAAFYARHWGGRDYREGALFTLKPAGGQVLNQAAHVRVFHAFGDPRIDWRGASYSVRREEEVAARGSR